MSFKIILVFGIGLDRPPVPRSGRGTWVTAGPARLWAPQNQSATDRGGLFHRDRMPAENQGTTPLARLWVANTAVYGYGPTPKK